MADSALSQVENLCYSGQNLCYFRQTELVLHRLTTCATSGDRLGAGLEPGGRHRKLLGEFGHLAAG